MQSTSSSNWTRIAESSSDIERNNATGDRTRLLRGCSQALYPLTLRRIARLAGAVEYTNCISVEGEDFPNKCPGYDSKNVMVRFQECWNFEEYSFTAIVHRSTLAPSVSTW